MPKFFSTDPAPERRGAASAVAEEETAGGYDRVGVVVGGEVRWMTKDQFQGLALTERVRLLSGGVVRFYRGTLEITPMEAMRGVP